MRRWESGRHGEGEGVGRYESLIQVSMGFVVLVWIHVTPGWENYPMWIHEGWKGREVRGMSGKPLQVDIGWRVEKGGAGLRIMAT